MEIIELRGKTSTGPLLAALCLFSTLILAQEPTPMQRANQLVAESNWSEARTALEAVVAAEPGNAMAWYQLGRACNALGAFDRAIEASNQAIEAGFPAPALARLSIAEANAGSGDHASTWRQLESLAAQGPNRGLLTRIEASAAFGTLRQDPRWDDVVGALTPCSAPEYRQFDFWLGDFRVEDPNGNHVGDNLISLHLDGCMLMESWQGLSGMHGMSMNFYDPSDQTWNQVFVDNNGAPASWPPLKGRFENGAMVLWSPEGESRTRWTWTEVAKGKVRQMAESTSDGGKTWQTIWDSYYLIKH